MNAEIEVVVAVDEADSEDVLEFVRACGAKPYLCPSLHEAFDRLIELQGTPCLLVRYQLQGDRNMGGRLLAKIDRGGLHHFPTIVLNKNQDDAHIVDTCYNYSFVKNVIREGDLWSSAVCAERIFFGANGIVSGVKTMSHEKPTRSRVFVVHRHKHPELKRVFSVLQQMSVDPIILPGEAPLSMTVVEAIEHFGDAEYGIAIFTADEQCISSPDEAPEFRARQNVIFETGFLMGKLERKRVMILYEDGVELPSDLKGILYIPLSISDDALIIKLHQTFSALEISHCVKTLGL